MNKKWEICEKNDEQINPMSINNNTINTAPGNPQEQINPIDLNNIQAPIVEEDDEMDIQKELEAKFDELFGPSEQSE